MKRRSVLLAIVLLAACRRDKAEAALPPPREVTAASVAQFCGMALSEHAGPNWFATVRDAFAFALLPEMPKPIAAFYVSDMARASNWDQPEPGVWVDAHHAWFVIGSRRRSGMDTDEAIPFGDAAAAHRFAEANGGRVVRFAEMPSDYILSAPPGHS
jgi:nitrous oxide reductase accessory protein NosL